RGRAGARGATSPGSLTVKPGMSNKSLTGPDERRAARGVAPGSGGGSQGRRLWARLGHARDRRFLLLGSMPDIHLGLTHRRPVRLRLSRTEIRFAFRAF